MAFKIVLVGGGSCIWTPTFAADLLLRERLAGCSLVLVDTEPDALALMLAYVRRMQDVLGSRWTIGAAPLDEALSGADVVCVSISTGGFAAMALDCAIPERFGVYHTVGDSVGPGGIARTLRNVPVFVDIARRMERLCPDAWMIHVTNPLSQLTRAVARTTRIRVAGLCHNYAGTAAMLAHFLGADPATLHAVSVGVNHFTWMKSLTVAGRSVDDRLSLDAYVAWHQSRHAPVKTGTTDDQLSAALVGPNMEYYFNFELFERFGYFPIGASNHVAENLPYWCNDPAVQRAHHIRRKGVLPVRQEMKDRKMAQIRAILAGEAPFPACERSNESFADIVESLRTGIPSRAIVSMPNRGQITNLPMDAVVETWAEINGSGVFPLQSGDVPAGVAGMVRVVIDEQELSVEAALTGDRRLVVQALEVSPELADKQAAPALADALLEAHRALLPQFFPRGWEQMRAQE